MEQPGIYFGRVPDGIIRWGANNLQPGDEKTTFGRLLRGLQKLHRQEKRRNDAVAGNANKRAAGGPDGKSALAQLGGFKKTSDPAAAPEFPSLTRV